MVCTTKAYNKAEVEQAKKDCELIGNAGLPSYQEALNMLQDGNIVNMPLLTAKDLRRTQELYGNPLEYVHGKLTKSEASRAVVDDDLVLDKKERDTAH
jgi:hypothetical protein